MELLDRAAICKAVRDVREAAGLTQQQLAVRLDKAVRTIPRWETNSPPRGKDLVQFERLAIQAGREDLAKIFRRAITAELETASVRIPMTIEEGLLVDLLLLAMRNRQMPAIKKHYPGVARTLAASFEAIDTALRRGQKVYGLNAGDAEVLRGEVKALSRDLKGGKK